MLSRKNSAIRIIIHSRNKKKQLHALLTNIMMDDAGYILDKTLDELKKEMTKRRMMSSRIKTQKRVPSSQKASKDKLVQTLELAQKTLIDTLQGELYNPSKSAETNDNIREDTIKQLIQFLWKNGLHEPKSEDWEESAIYISVS